jgi:hypothetical protein
VTDKLKSIYLRTIASVARVLSDRRQRTADPPMAVSARHFPAPVQAALARLPDPVREATARMVVAAHAAGVAEERARISSIMELPAARGLAPLAWQLAKRGDFTPEKAAEALCAAAVDAVAVAGAVTAAGAERQASTIH